MNDEAGRQMGLSAASNRRTVRKPSAAASSDPVAELEASRRKIDSAIKALRKVRQLGKQAAKDPTKLTAAIKAARAALEVPPPGTISGAMTWLEQVERDLVEAESAASKRFSIDLDAALSDSSSRLGGHLPLLTWWYFAIEVGAASARIWYGPQIQEIKKTKLVAPSVATALLDARRSFEGEGFDHEAFLEQLYQAYIVSRAAEAHLASDRVPIARVYTQLLLRRQPKSFSDDPFRGSLRPYPGMQFSFDLHRLTNRRRGDEVLRLEGASKSRTRKRADSLWVPTDSNGNGFWYSHLYFRRGS